MAEIFDLQKALKIRDGLFAVTDSIVEHYESKAAKMFPDAIGEIERLRADNEILLNVVTAGDTNIIVNSKEQAKRIQSLESELDTKSARIRILEQTVENMRKVPEKQEKKINELEAALIIDRTEKLVMAFAGYEPPMTMEDCEQMARKQLHTEGLL